MSDIEPGDWTALNETLAKYARVVNNLRRRIEALESGASASPSATKPAPEQADVPTVGTTGHYAPNPNCLGCGRNKGNRKELTCVECGRERNRIITEGGARPSYRTCGNCGAVKGGGMQMLCGPCSRSFKKWKATK